MPAYQRVELADDLRVSAALQIRVDACEEAGEPQAFEARDLRLGEPGVGDVGERRSAPEGERVS